MFYLTLSSLGAHQISGLVGNYKHLAPTGPTDGGTYDSGVALSPKRLASELRYVSIVAVWPKT